MEEVKPKTDDNEAMDVEPSSAQTRTHDVLISTTSMIDPVLQLSPQVKASFIRLSQKTLFLLLQTML